MCSQLVRLAKQIAFFPLAFWAAGCTTAVGIPPDELIGDLSHLASAVERGNNYLAERNSSMRETGEDRPRQISIITAFDNSTKLFIDSFELQLAWECKFAERSRCRLIWAQNWDEEKIAHFLDRLEVRSRRQSLEGQGIDITLCRLELISSSVEKSADSLCLRITRQDLLMRSEIDRLEIPLALDSAKFLIKN